MAEEIGWPIEIDYRQESTGLLGSLDPPSIKS